MKETITLRDVYDIANRLEGKMDTRLERHELRIEGLENNQSRALGVLSVISLFISGAMTLLWNRLLGRS